MTEVAEADGVSVAAVHKSIQQGLKSMKNICKMFDVGG